MPARTLSCCASLPAGTPWDRRARPPIPRRPLTRLAPYHPPGREADGSTPEQLASELARFFGYSHDLLAILDDRGTALVLSPSFERVLGWGIAEIAGLGMLRLVHEADRVAVGGRARELSAERPTLELDARMLRADGGSVPMRWSLSLGPHRRIYAVGHDRTAEARRAEATLSSEMAELRLRTAMELHDGILQTLTGASLQIAVARRLVRRDPAAAEEVLASLGATISAEQQEMRLYVDEVKGQSPLWVDANLRLRERIAAMLDRVEAVWGVDVALEADITAEPPAETGRQVLRIIQESTVNAARHGGARTVAVRVRHEGSDIAIRIVDDGHGFSFLGDLDTEALREQRLGPLSLKHRVEDCGGRLAIRSTREGATISIWVPARTERTETE
jgi:PAS domain S-box-containing protein